MIVAFPSHTHLHFGDHVHLAYLCTRTIETTKKKSSVLKFCHSRLLSQKSREDHSGKSATIRESNHGSGVCNENYA